MRLIISSSVALPAVQYLSTLSHKMQDFREKKLLNINVCFDFSRKLFARFFTIRRILRDIVINVRTSSCKYPLLLSDFNET
jgi:hypothetical protein